MVSFCGFYDWSIRFILINDYMAEFHIILKFEISKDL